MKIINQYLNQIIYIKINTIVLFTNKLFLLFQQELQRRLDQTLGKPGSYLGGIDRAGNVKPMTIGARLCRVEQQVTNDSNI